jgi:hypothetical protein
MKKIAIFALLLLIEVAATSLADASTPHTEASVSSENAKTGGGRLEVWGAERSGKDIYFYLRDEDLGRDFAVFTTGSLKEEWQLLRWVKRNSRIVLLTSSGRREELLPDWTVAAVTSAEFPVLHKNDGRYRVKATSLFYRGFPSGSGGLERIRGVAEGGFEVPKLFPKNLVIRWALDSRKGHPGATLVRWNFVKLPEIRMATRRSPEAAAFDPRGGWLAEHNFPRRLVPNEVALRWRLEGAASSSALVEPDSPIIFYVDPSTPERWRRWVAAGIESWNSAFESAGYTRAVRAVTPIPASDMDYDDLRYSVLCWGSKKRGCNNVVFDPRTGEILQYQISGQEIALEELPRYIVTLAAIDSRVLESPLPEALLGAIVQKVATHEAGHALGLRDGNYGAFTYSSTQVRDKEWVKVNDFTPSVMNYARFNFLTQPEDGMPADLLINKPGPADLFWIRWGYGHDANDVIEELWNSSPLYRYRVDDGRMDPYKISETPGVSDPVLGAQLGMRNLGRSMALLERHVFHETDPEVASRLDARSIHNAALVQWYEMHKQVLSLVGGRLMGANQKNSTGTQDPITYENEIPMGAEIDPERQKDAVILLCDSFFSKTPEFLVYGAINQAAGLDRQAVESSVARRREIVFEELTSSRLLDQMVRSSGERMITKDHYDVAHLMRDMKTCVVR